VCGHDKEKTDAAQSVEAWTKGGGVIVRKTEFVSVQGKESWHAQIVPAGKPARKKYLLELGFRNNNCLGRQPK